jgi:hypothetical protein
MEESKEGLSESHFAVRNATRTELGAKPRDCGVKLATNRLNIKGSRQFLVNLRRQVAFVQS